MTLAGHPLDLVEEIVCVRGRDLSILRPRDSEALLDEEAFEHEEYLPYWAELWPSGPALARVVAGLPLRGARVVELGCGLAIPSIAAALAGARVLATDWSPDAVALAARNAERNGASLQTAIRSWSEPEDLVSGAPWDVVLASDVLYERRNVDLLLALLPRLVREGGRALVADPSRPHTRAFLESAAAGWRVESQHDRVSPRVAIHTLTRAR